MTYNLKERQSLREEIAEGKLFLRGDLPKRYRFSFSFQETPIGVYGVRSVGPFCLELSRAYNNTLRATLDPSTGLYTPQMGRLFGCLRPNLPMFLVEFEELSTVFTVRDRVAFVCKRLQFSERVLPREKGKDLNLEVVTLKGLEFCG